MIIEEPVIEQGKNPEKSLHIALVSHLKMVGEEIGRELIILDEFGLDIAIFYAKEQQVVSRFIELKTFVGSRQGGVGIGNGRGYGVQIDLLLLPDKQLELLNDSILWILGFGTMPIGTSRYKIFSCVDAKNAAMGGINRGKQNNLRISDLAKDLLTWKELLESTFSFIID